MIVEMTGKQMAEAAFWWVIIVGGTSALLIWAFY